MNDTEGIGGRIAVSRRKRHADCTCEAMDQEELHLEVTRILMDTGSSKMYVSEELVKRLNIETEHSNRRTFYTFGVNKPRKLTLTVVTITLKSKDGNTVTVKANVVPKISRKINKHPVHLGNKLKFQRTFKLLTRYRQVEKHQSSAS